MKKKRKEEKKKSIAKDRDVKFSNSSFCTLIINLSQLFLHIYTNMYKTQFYSVFLPLSFRAPVHRLLWSGQTNPHACGWLAPGRPPAHRLGHRRGGTCGRIPERLRDGSGPRSGPGGARDRQRPGQRQWRRRSRKWGRKHRSVVQSVIRRSEVAGEPSGFSAQPQVHSELEPSPALFHLQHHSN